MPFLILLFSLFSLVYAETTINDLPFSVRRKIITEHGLSFFDQAQASVASRNFNLNDDPHSETISKELRNVVGNLTQSCSRIILFKVDGEFRESFGLGKQSQGLKLRVDHTPHKQYKSCLELMTNHLESFPPFEELIVQADTPSHNNTISAITFLRRLSEIKSVAACVKSTGFDSVDIKFPGVSELYDQYLATIDTFTSLRYFDAIDTSFGNTTKRASTFRFDEDPETYSPGLAKIMQTKPIEAVVIDRANARVLLHSQYDIFSWPNLTHIALRDPNSAMISSLVKRLPSFKHEIFFKIDLIRPVSLQNLLTAPEAVGFSIDPPLMHFPLNQLTQALKRRTTGLRDIYINLDSIFDAEEIESFLAALKYHQKRFHTTLERVKIQTSINYEVAWAIEDFSEEFPDFAKSFDLQIRHNKELTNDADLKLMITYPAKKTRGARSWFKKKLKKVTHITPLKIMFQLRVFQILLGILTFIVYLQIVESSQFYWERDAIVAALVFSGVALLLDFASFALKPRKWVVAIEVVVAISLFASSIAVFSKTATVMSKSFSQYYFTEDNSFSNKQEKFDSVLRELLLYFAGASAVIFDYATPAKFTHTAIKEAARDATQLLLNRIFELPTKVEDHSIFAQLEEPTYRVPRCKSLPQDKPMTKWEKFAKSKGIKKRKRDRFEYNDEMGEDRPRFGYKSAKNDPIQDWCVEVPDNENPMEDHLAKRKDAKKARVEKNKKQQKRNAEGVNLYEKMKGIQQSKTDRQEPILKKLKTSQVSTASMGRFDKKLDNEPKLNRDGGKKRKFESNTGAEKGEAEKSKKIAEKVMKAALSKQSVLSSQGAIQISKEGRDKPMRGKKGMRGDKPMRGGRGGRGGRGSKRD